jgi:transcription elongation factor GreA
MATEDPVLLTEQGKDGLERERDTLRNDKLPALRRRIQELSADGDVSDNSEYEDTKEELVQLEARIREIEHVLRHAKVAPPSHSSDIVQFGSTVTLVDDEGEVETWKIVSPQEANSLHGTISTKSPVGAALIGKRMGDDVVVSAPGGETRFTIQKVE